MVSGCRSLCRTSSRFNEEMTEEWQSTSAAATPTATENLGPKIWGIFGEDFLTQTLKDGS